LNYFAVRAMTWKQRKKSLPTNVASLPIRYLNHPRASRLRQQGTHTRTVQPRFLYNKLDLLLQAGTSISSVYATL
jgi:hypothetical protein